MFSSLNYSFVFAIVAVSALVSSVSAFPTNDGASGRGAVAWYGPCPGISNKGEIRNVSLSNCVLGNCYLDHGVAQELSIYFRAGENHDSLLYNLYLTSGVSNYYIDGGNYHQSTVGGSIYSFVLNFVVPDKVRDGNNSVEVYLFKPQNPTVYEFCIQFDIDGVVHGPEPTSTTEDYTESVTTTTQVTDVTDTTISSTTPKPDSTTTEEDTPTPTTTTEEEQSTTDENTSSEPTTTSASSTTTTTEEPETTTPEIPDSTPAVTATTPDLTSPASTTPEPFTCQNAGVYPDPASCTVYHVCTPLADGSFWDQEQTCAPATVFCPDRFNCDYPTTCPCSRP